MFILNVALIERELCGCVSWPPPPIWPAAKELRTGNKQADASDSHQGQSVKPLPNFQVSLRENTRGRVKPGGGEGGGGSVRWRIWNWMTDVTWLLVNYPAGAPLRSGWETHWRPDYQFGVGKTLFESIVSFQAGWQLQGSCLWLRAGVGFLALTCLSDLPPHQLFNKISYQAFHQMY